MAEDTQAQLRKNLAAAQENLGQRPPILDRQPSQARRKLKEPPRLSIISCSMNLARFLEETLATIENQTFDAYELIVADGASRDGTLEILKKYPQARVISEPDQGYTDALWKGLAMARGEYFMQCAVSDGFLDEGWFARCVAMMDQHPEVSLVWGFARYLTEESLLGPVAYSQFHQAPPANEQAFFNHWMDTAFWFPEGNFCVRRRVFEECFPRFTPALKELEPYLEFNYQFQSRGYLAHFLPVVANYGRTHQNQLGQREDKAGIGQQKLARYMEQVKTYAAQVKSGLQVHQFRNGKGEVISSYRPKSLTIWNKLTARLRTRRG